MTSRRNKGKGKPELGNVDSDNNVGSSMPCNICGDVYEWIITCPSCGGHGSYWEPIPPDELEDEDQYDGEEDDEENLTGGEASGSGSGGKKKNKLLNWKWKKDKEGSNSKKDSGKESKRPQMRYRYCLECRTSGEVTTFCTCAEGRRRKKESDEWWQEARELAGVS
jgi:hypothetical protein